MQQNMMVLAVAAELMGINVGELVSISTTCLEKEVSELSWYSPSDYWPRTDILEPVSIKPYYVSYDMCGIFQAQARTGRTQSNFGDYEEGLAGH